MPLNSLKDNTYTLFTHEIIVCFSGNAKQRRVARRAYSRLYRVLKLDDLLEGKQRRPHVYYNYTNKNITIHDL